VKLPGAMRLRESTFRISTGMTATTQNKSLTGFTKTSAVCRSATGCSHWQLRL